MTFLEFLQAIVTALNAFSTGKLIVFMLFMFPLLLVAMILAVILVVLAALAVLAATVMFYEWLCRQLKALRHWWRSRRTDNAIRGISRR